MKIRKALEKTWDYLTPEKASEFKGSHSILIFCNLVGFVTIDVMIVLPWLLLWFHARFHFFSFIFHFIFINYINYFLPLQNAGEVQCEQPNNSLYTFTGNVIIQKQTLPLSPNQLLLRVRIVFFFSFQFCNLASYCCVPLSPLKKVDSGPIN